MMNDIKLSIIVAVYCHEQYIEQAIKSILLQKVNFNYEVLIGEDCSPDRSADVLRKMEQQLPSYFHIYYREKNLGEHQNNYDLQDKAQGDYIIFLEGDDYWTDSHKLQKQADFLDAHPDYIAVAHSVKVVDAQGVERFDFVYPQCPKEEFTISDFCEGYLCGQTASMMMRNIYKEKTFPLLKLDFYYPGDQQKNFMLAGHGRVYSSCEVMSAYRYVPENGTSYSASIEMQSNLRLRQIRAYKVMYQYAIKEFCTEDVEHMEWAYMKCLAYAVRDRLAPEYTIRYFIREFTCCRNKLKLIKSFGKMATGFVMRRVRRKKVGERNE